MTDIMKAYSKYQDWLESHGVPKEISGIPQVVEQVEKQFKIWAIGRKEKFYSKFDFGKHEFGEIDNLATHIVKLKVSIYMSIIDYDIKGRPLIQTRLKKLIKKPWRSFHYHFCKGFYLWLANNKEFGTYTSNDPYHLDDMWHNSYDNHMPEIIAKYRALQEAQVWRILSK